MLSDWSSLFYGVFGGAAGFALVVSFSQAYHNFKVRKALFELLVVVKRLEKRLDKKKGVDE